LETRRWYWEESTSDWGVELDEAAGLLRWWGADKPRPGVPAYAQGGGGRDQPIREFLESGLPAYRCPPHVLAELLEAARSWQATPR
jgi:hypothetical protein